MVVLYLSRVHVAAAAAVAAATATATAAAKDCNVTSVGKCVQLLEV